MEKNENEKFSLSPSFSLSALFSYRNNFYSIKYCLTNSYSFIYLSASSLFLSYSGKVIANTSI